MSIIRQRKMRLKKNSMIITVILFITIMIILITFVYLKLSSNFEVKTIEEKKDSLSSSSEIILKSKQTPMRNDITDDLRLHYYSNIKLSDKVSIGDYIDVRISYANGMDFIILPKKKVLDVSISNNNLDSALWLEVSEEEILRMSSAFVDMNHHESCLVYAIKYLNETQNIAKANYPVNEEVRKLIDSDPNIINKGINLIESTYRNVIDEIDYLPNSLEENTVIEGENSIDTSKRSDMQEDIVYLD